MQRALTWLCGQSRGLARTAPQALMQSTESLQQLHGHCSVASRQALSQQPTMHALLIHQDSSSEAEPQCTNILASCSPSLPRLGSMLTAGDLHKQGQ
jgi:hypothetical protein